MGCSEFYFVIMASSQATSEEVMVLTLKQKHSHRLFMLVDEVEKAIYAFNIHSLVALEIRYWFV